MTIVAIERRLKKHGLILGIDIPSGEYYVKGKPGWYRSHNQIAQSRWFKNL